jgi:hypothetical protein
MRKDRAPRARRGLAALLLTTTFVFSLLALGAGPVLADGGQGGAGGGAGGADSIGATGGNGGSTNTGNGGDCGVGIQFAAGGVFTNSGTIEGGNGGAAGTSVSGAWGSGGVGGLGVVGEGLHLINAGTIRGGFGDGGAQANAITFTGGSNILELHSTSKAEGVVAVTSGTGTLRLGGATDGTFDSTAIDSMYTGFTAFQKTGSSTWQLTSVNFFAPARARNLRYDDEIASASDNHTLNLGLRLRW